MIQYGISVMIRLPLDVSLCPSLWTILIWQYGDFPAKNICRIHLLPEEWCAVQDMWNVLRIEAPSNDHRSE